MKLKLDLILYLSKIKVIKAFFLSVFFFLTIKGFYEYISFIILWASFDALYKTSEKQNNPSSSTSHLPAREHHPREQKYIIKPNFKGLWSKGFHSHMAPPGWGYIQTTHIAY